MQENLAMIMYGCKLAKDLEQNLPMLANQPNILLSSCEEIARVFNSIKERLISQGQKTITGGGIQEWLRSSGGAASSTTATTTGIVSPEPMELLNAQAVPNQSGKKEGMLIAQQQSSGLGLGPGPAGLGAGLEFVVRGLSGGSSRSSGVGDIRPDSSRASPPQRLRRRRDEGEKVVQRVAAPQMGNLDLPPEDGYTWRKYGQKEILGSIYPRSYYRCTHQKFYECPAKKQVQRLDDDPFTFEVTYRGNHTCHLSSTAPMPPSVQASLPPTTTVHHPPTVLPLSSSLPNPHWLTMQILHEFGGISATTTSSGGGAGPSTARWPEYQLPVADMADVMFNSGSSSSNSMDLIFSSMDEKWDSEVKKNQN